MRFWPLPATILLCILIILTLFLTGCTTSRGIGSEVPQGEGITDITPRDERERISLDEALLSLENTDLAGTQGSSPLHIYYIRGESIDSNGTARGWIIGAIRDQKAFYFVSTGSGQQIMDCNSDLPSHEIAPENILTPDALFRQRPLLIQDLTERGNREIDSLEIRDGSYIMTFRSDSKVRVFYFDAASGIETGQI